MNIVLLELTGNKTTIEITENDSISDLYDEILTSLNMDVQFEMEPNNDLMNDEKKALIYFQELGLDPKQSYRVLARMCTYQDPEDKNLLKGYYRISLTKEHIKAIGPAKTQSPSSKGFFDNFNNEEFNGSSAKKSSVDSEGLFNPY